ncbi:MAG: type II toxin-antitoxin system RelE/ParE family toxin [Ekhidna sp.]|nr:type II toxin-antitoxin system RelE/ParE family toxin [Ekhidna sp.]
MIDNKVIWSARSLKDLERAHGLLAEKSSQAANQMIGTVLERVEQLEQFPESGAIELSLSQRKKSHRYLVSGHHKIIYRIEKKSILIVRVFDTRQDPEKLK